MCVYIYIDYRPIKSWYGLRTVMRYILDSAISVAIYTQGIGAKACIAYFIS